MPKKQRREEKESPKPTCQPRTPKCPSCKLVGCMHSHTEGAICDLCNKEFDEGVEMWECKRATCAQKEQADFCATCLSGYKKKKSKKGE